MPVLVPFWMITPKGKMSKDLKKVRAIIRKLTYGRPKVEKIIK